MKKCPKCRIVNADFATTCDCGFNFTTNTGPPTASADSLAERASGVILKLLGGIFAFVVAVVILGALGIKPRSPSGSPVSGTTPVLPDTQIEKYLSNISDELNSTLPMMIDKDVRLDTTRGGPGRNITYAHTLVNLSSEEVRSAGLIESFQPTLKQNVCGNTDMALLFKSGITVRYLYHGSDGKEVGKLDITPSDCGF